MNQQEVNNSSPTHSIDMPQRWNIRKNGFTYVGYVDLHRPIGRVGKPLLYRSP
jgi:hypothetical protein